VLGLLLVFSFSPMLLLLLLLLLMMMHDGD